ncbi:protein fem-1 homolog CG6966-like [Ornithodoros turicata]|uniref:Putative ankyrin repeat protein n=1 Tax=Ornithodoros turicata TaxID=34597 RepID=A0A2R5LL18_9ACAR
MEFKSVVFNAAKDGNLKRLKVFLDHRPKDEMAMLTSAKTDGSTPLVMAARNGHLEVIEYLIERCNADIEQVGSVTFDGETIEGAPPLWCAAAAGYMNVVQSLVVRGASVNATTSTNSTPLRAACFDGHFEIVRFLVRLGADIEIANRHGHTCLMIACYKGHLDIAAYLVACGADVNRKSAKGNTALHDCAESGSLDILRLLLNHGAVSERDSYGLTPLLAAAVTGHGPVVEYLSTLDSCSRLERIEALELLGATYIDKKRDTSGALRFWHRALKERHCSKPPILKPKREPAEAYGNAVEAQTLTDLEDLFYDLDRMQMQALLVRERVLGSAHPDTAYYIRYRGAVSADLGDFPRCLRLWLYALDMQQKCLEPLSPMTQSSLLSFAELFYFMLVETRSRSGPSRRLPALVSFGDVLAVFHRAVNELASAPILSSTEEAVHRTLVVALQLCTILCRLSPCPEQEEELKSTVYRLIKLNVRGTNGETPLHLACRRDPNSAPSSLGTACIVSFPSAELAKLLLELGSDPNAVDKDGRTPLHTSARAKPFAAFAVAKVLLAHGAHLDKADKMGNVATDYCSNLLDNSPLHYTSLKCLCARVIVRLRVPYRGFVPRNLEDFVECH